MRNEVIKFGSIYIIDCLIGFSHSVISLMFDDVFANNTGYQAYQNSIGQYTGLSTIIDLAPVFVGFMAPIVILIAIHWLTGLIPRLWGREINLTTELLSGHYIYLYHGKTNKLI